MGSCDETKHTCLVKATPGTDGQGICTFDKVRTQSLYFIEGRSPFSIKTQTEFFHLASAVMEQFSERSAPLGSLIICYSSHFLQVNVPFRQLLNEETLFGMF